jgi:hypothetical protein
MKSSGAKKTIYAIGISILSNWTVLTSSIVAPILRHWALKWFTPSSIRWFAVRFIVMVIWSVTFCDKSWIKYIYIEEAEKQKK